MEKISFLDEDGNVVEFYLLEQTRISDCDYLLVTDSEEDEADAYILKDVSEEDDPQACYEFVEDDLEFEVVSDVFVKMADDVEFQ